MSKALEDLLERAQELEAKAAAGVLDTDGVSALAEAVDVVEDGFDPDWDDLVEEPAGVDFEDPEVKAAGSACSSCGSTDVDEYADGSVVCDGCGAELQPAEKKAMNFEDLPDDVLFETKREYDRDGAGKFASDGSSSGDKEPERGEDGKVKRRDVDDIRELVRGWGDVPKEKREALKAQLLSRLKAMGDKAPERLVALVEGLGDGDGKREAGEGAAAAVRRGEGGDWLRENGFEKDDDDKKSGAPLEAAELARLQEFKALLD